MKTKDKKFDAMQMMRKIREKLSQKYREDTESERKKLPEIRKNIG